LAGGFWYWLGAQFANSRRSQIFGALYLSPARIKEFQLGIIEVHLNDMPPTLCCREQRNAKPATAAGTGFYLIDIARFHEKLQSGLFERLQDSI
jgi:hypothetical protein